MKDLTGQKFNNLTVLEFSHRKGTSYFGNANVIVEKKL